MALGGHITRIDRAIFTSVKSMTGQGYRIVACSPGVTAEERKTIALSSPSHGAMSDDSDEAQGLAFYDLGPERYCLARSCHAGREQSARGGQRVLTHSFVQDAEGLAAFGWNPFAVLRVLASADAFAPDIHQSGTLEALEMVAVDDTGAGRAIDRAFSILKEPVLMYLLDRAMQAGYLILPGLLDEPLAVLEGLFLLMPEAMRGECSFSVGLKFALSRRHRLVFAGPDTSKAQRLTRGQPFTIVKDLSAKAASNIPQGRWCQMVVDCHRCGRIDDLLALEALTFDEASLAALDQIAQRQIDLNHIEEAATDSLLDALWPTEAQDASRVEQTLIRQFARSAKALVFDRLRQAPIGEVKRLWPILLSLADVDQEVGRFCLDLFDQRPTLDPAPAGADCAPASAHSDGENAPAPEPPTA